MKFLVLALCVCAASAASFGSGAFRPGGYKNYKGFQSPAAAPAVVAASAVGTAAAPAVFAAKTVATAAVAPAVFAANTVAAGSDPVVAPAGKAAIATYSAANQVVNKPYSSEANADILRSDSEVRPDGYNYAYETANGISAQAVGTYKQVGESGVVVTQGGYRYVSPEGVNVEISYVADENGYQPQGDLLPVAPEVPAAISRALAYIAAHPSSEYAQKY